MPADHAVRRALARGRVRGARDPRVVREQHAPAARPQHGEELLRRPLRARGQRVALHEDSAASALLERRKEAGGFDGEESRALRLGIRADQRARGARDGRTRFRNVRREGNDGGRGRVRGEAGDQPVEDVLRDARAPVEEKNLARRARTPAPSGRRLRPRRGWPPGRARRSPASSRAAGDTPGSARKSVYGGRACRSSAPRHASRTGRSSCARTTTSTASVERSNAGPRKRTGSKPGTCTSPGSCAGAAALSPAAAPPAKPPFSFHHALRSFQKKLISIAAMRARASESSTRVFSSSSRRSSNLGSLTGTGSRRRLARDTRPGSSSEDR